MDTTFCEMMDYGYDVDPRDEFQIEKFETTIPQEDFLYDLIELWNDVNLEPYTGYCETIDTILAKGWYDEEQQYELMEMRELYIKIKSKKKK